MQPLHIGCTHNPYLGIFNVIYISLRGRQGPKGCSDSRTFLQSGIHILKQRPSHANLKIRPQKWPQQFLIGIIISAALILIESDSPRQMTIQEKWVKPNSEYRERWRLPQVPRAVAPLASTAHPFTARY